MRKPVFISFAKNTFQVSDGESGFKEFSIYNFDNEMPTFENVEIKDPATSQLVSVLVSKNASQVSLRNVPYIPVFQAMWNNVDINLKNFKEFMKSNFSISRIFKHNAVIIMPDDSIEIDNRSVIDFLTTSGFINKIYLFGVGLVLDSPDNYYMAVTKSVRAVALSLIKDGGILKQEFFPVDHNDVENLKALMVSWSNQFNISNPSVLLHGRDIDTLSAVGTVISDSKVLDFVKMVRKHLM